MESCFHFATTNSINNNTTLSCLEKQGAVASAITRSQIEEGFGWQVWPLQHLEPLAFGNPRSTSEVPFEPHCGNISLLWLMMPH